ncbi:hypothetical protein [Cardinium endosymbiont of Tipula unca]
MNIPPVSSFDTTKKRIYFTILLIFSIRLLVKIVVLATCTKACFLSQKV